VNNKTIIAVDLGGTWMRAAAVKNGMLAGQVVRKPTGRKRSASAIIKDLIALTAEVVSGRQVGEKATIRMALGVPTPIDDTKRLTASDNLPTMGGIALGKEITKRTGWTVKSFNDALCFTAGEWQQGLGKGLRFFCGVTLGTGVGLGIVADGRLVKGSHGMAGEIWNSSLGDGHVEDFVGGAGLKRLFKTRTGRSLSGEELRELAEKGDSDAIAAFAEFGGFLGQALAWIVNCLDPEAIALGGSIAESFAHFERSMHKAMKKYCSHKVRALVAPAQLGEKAALIGTAMLFEAQN